MKPSRAGVLALVLIVLPVRAPGGDSCSVGGFHVREGFGPRKVIATTAVGGMLLTSLIWSYDSWWKDAGRPFNFFSENWLNSRALGIDKIGHLYTSYFYFHTLRNVMLWGGYEPATADWWALGGSLFFALAVEVGDGATNYGFDYQDLVFNAMGLGYGWLQARIPALREFTLKWTYAPDTGYRFPMRFTDYYDAHTYWLSCNPDNLLPSALARLWPDFLAVAVGFSVDDNVTRREFVIGFDLDVERLFSTGNAELLLLQKEINLFHIPAPAIKFTERKEPRYYLFQKN